jgi:branched-chain amino acid transport system substrate-binding protein
MRIIKSRSLICSTIFGIFLLLSYIPSDLSAGESGPGYVHKWTAPFEFLGPGREMDNDWRLQIPEVQIGLLGSFAGGGGAYGRAMEEGVIMALDEINKKGGLFGRKVVIVKGDDENDMGKNGHETVRLIDEGVWGILGSVHSGCTHVAARITLKSEVPQLTSISTDPTIGLINSPWMFRCLVDDRGQGQALADLIFNKLKYKEVGLIMHNNRYGKMGGKEITAIAKAQKTPVAFQELFESDQTDFSKIIAKIKSSKVEAIIVWGLYGPAGKLVRELGRQGINVQIFGSDGVVAPAFIDVAGIAADKAIVTYPYDETRSDPVNLNFIRKFKKIYGHEPDSFSAHGYDAMNLMCTALKKSGLNRYRLRDTLANTKDFHGVTGFITFDHQGNDTRSVTFARIINGHFVPLREKDFSELANRN